jgi:NADPH-dependent 2,4-dienoyl-CoA reductase/sulfur reductase-like enzyme
VSSRLRRVVVVGGGVAGLRAAETLRRQGYAGSLTMIGGESELPYARPPLSKEMLTASAPPSVHLHGLAQFERLDVELVLGREAASLDLDARTVIVGDDASPFDGLILATGARPRMLPALEGVAGVQVLRTLDDALALRGALRDARHIAVIGAGFIGSEVASSAHALGVEVTIVDVEENPLARRVGPAVGNALLGLHRRHGANLRLGAAVAGAESGPAGRIRLRLSDGTALDVDTVVVGIGVIPNTAWLEGSGLTLADGIVCGVDLSTDHPGVYAAGDVANIPDGQAQTRTRVEHWTNAAEQARHAARNLLGERPAPFASRPYFWSDQYGRRIMLAGRYGEHLHIVDGGLGDDRWFGLYGDGERVTGAIALDCPQLFGWGREMVQERSPWRDALARAPHNAAAAPTGG